MNSHFDGDLDHGTDVLMVCWLDPNLAQNSIEFPHDIFLKCAQHLYIFLAIHGVFFSLVLEQEPRQKIDAA